MGNIKKLNFIVIDDSKLDCFIAEKVITNTGKSGEVRSFVSAEQALETIISAKYTSFPHTIILVDIQMPVMNGFQFIEAFEQLGPEVINNYSIFVISSSINENDLKRVDNYISVKQFLNKPLNSNILGALVDQY
jgi:CheY-like chemotaxis protein